MKKLLPLLALLLACGPAPRPSTNPLVQHSLTVHVLMGDRAPVPQPLTIRVVDPEPNPNAHGVWQTNANGDIGLPLKEAGFTICVDEIAGYKGSCQGVTLTSDMTVTITLERLAPPIPQLHPDGPIWRDAAGHPWRWKGVSAFQLLDRFAKGEDIGPFLKTYRGYNVLRVWLYVPVADWGAAAWSAPDAATIRAFVARVQRDGFLVELTLLTDDDPAKLAWAQQLVPQLGGLTGVFLEAGNEPTTHKNINTAALIPAMQASGLPWTTGNYENAALMRGVYGVTHTQRDREWPRRAHDLMEFFNGGGPNAPSDPAHHIPIVADEPTKLQDVSGDRLKDWRAYFATCSLLGAGATFHSETGKFAQLPTPDEAQLAAVALEAMDAFPADAPLGHYSRPDEGPGSLRTYIVGGYMVRIRPTTPAAPQPGWAPLDGDGITWRRQ